MPICQKYHYEWKLNENAEKVEKQVDTCNIVLSVLRVVVDYEWKRGWQRFSIGILSYVQINFTVLIHTSKNKNKVSQMVLTSNATPKNSTI